MKFCEPTSKYCSAALKSSTLRTRFSSRNVSSSRVALNPAYCTLSTLPPPKFAMTGPLLRRGSVSTTAGTSPPAGTVTTVSAPSPSPLRALTLNVTGTGITCSCVPMYSDDRPLGDVASGTSCSRYVSVTSKPVVVSPQVTWRFWPSTTHGVPVTLLPMTSRPSCCDTRCTW